MEYLEGMVSSGNVNCNVTLARVCTGAHYVIHYHSYLLPRDNKPLL